jgi:hypothetical protein
MLLKRILLVIQIIIVTGCSALKDDRDLSLIKTSNAYFRDVGDAVLIIPLSFSFYGIVEKEEEDYAQISIENNAKDVQIKVGIYKNNQKYVNLKKISAAVIDYNRNKCRGLFWYNPNPKQIRFNNHDSFEFATTCNSVNSSDLKKENKAIESRYIFINDGQNTYQISYSKHHNGVFFKRLMSNVSVLIDMLSTIRSSQVCDKKNMSSKCKEFIYSNNTEIIDFNEIKSSKLKNKVPVDVIKSFKNISVKNIKDLYLVRNIGGKIGFTRILFINEHAEEISEEKIIEDLKSFLKKLKNQQNDDIMFVALMPNMKTLIVAEDKSSENVRILKRNLNKVLNRIFDH